MQARKLSLAEAHPSQVVKVEVDVASQCTAILLRNSSCLVYASVTDLSSSPSLIVPSCTDICFLRLRQRTTNLSSSSSSDKSAEHNFGSDHKKRANAKGKSSMHLAERIGDGIPKVVSMGDAAAGSVNEALLFLVLKPAKGGMCTDLLAWKCTERDFLQIPIFLDGSSNECNGPLAAQLDDISHGISVGIVASINVVAVHSPAVGRLWIFSAKQSSTKSQGPDTAYTQRDLILNNDSKLAFKMERDKHEKDNNNGLQLLKCAVVDCNGPAYAMHLSLQHLLVGQLGGVRVWLLRPLIKGSEMDRRDLKVASNCGKCIGLKQEKTKSSEEEESAKPIGETRSCNGHLSAVTERSESALALKNTSTVLAGPKNGCHEMSANQLSGASNSCMNGYSTTGGNSTGSRQGWGCNGKSSGEFFTCSNDGFTKLSTSSDMPQEAPLNVFEPVQHEAAAMPRYRNGTFLEFDSEELKSQQKFSQFSMLSSSSDSSSSLQHPQNTCACSASCQSLTSSLSSVAGAPGTMNASHKAEFRKATPAGVFIPLQKGQPTNFAKVEQVVSIHGLSERDFLVLGSNGKLHLLTLQYITRKDEATIQQAPRISLNASFQHLWCGIRIKYLSPLPDLNSGVKNSGFVVRKLWVSDGSHTLYLVTIPPKERAKEESMKTYAVHKNNLTVIGTIFLVERGCSLSALHENAVLVLTEGSMLEYSLTGS
ncbi:hypothetical protein GOP47_0006322 [Adiantum capillus-veneris]|uniref:Uncharacterized protein n=1 Tax=Adiantum capillus-veneris TaxID=13818 RepID=A0A9D4V3C8_ADICA|nr:hypothetical protein GOP47_0006322 [Adiantum capillus-veneris]